jgi:hypothetical protein
MKAVRRMPEILAYQLPSDVVQVHVARGGTKLEPQLAVRVQRQLPAAAYVLLIVSVLCASMYDISLQLLVCPASCLVACSFARRQANSTELEWLMSMMLIWQCILLYICSQWLKTVLEALLHGALCRG